MGGEYRDSNVCGGQPLAGAPGSSGKTEGLIQALARVNEINQHLSELEMMIGIPPEGNKSQPAQEISNLASLLSRGADELHTLIDESHEKIRIIADTIR